MAIKDKTKLKYNAIKWVNVEDSKKKKSYRRSHMTWFFLHEMTTRVKSTEAEAEGE